MGLRLGLIVLHLKPLTPCPYGFKSFVNAAGLAVPVGLWIRF